MHSTGAATRCLFAFLCVFHGGPLATAAAVRADEAATDQSYVAATGERVIRQSLVFDAPVARLWALYTTAAGLASWAAPRVEIDLRIGGSIQSNFKVEAKLGEQGTVVTEIISLIPDHEITLRDDLVDLLTMGGLYDWLDMFPGEFLSELETRGDDVFTTARFDALANNRTRLTIFSYGYGEGSSWDKVYAETKKSNLWFLDNLSRRLRRGPTDWTARP